MIKIYLTQRRRRSDIPRTGVRDEALHETGRIQGFGLGFVLA